MGRHRKTERNKEIVKKRDQKNPWSWRRIGDHYGLHHETVREIYKRETSV